MNKLNIFKMLEEFSSLREEIKETQTRIEKLRWSDKKYACDVVKGSGSQFPFISHNVVVEGVSDFSLSICQQEKILEERLTRLSLLVGELQKIIDNIPDSEIRRIMQFRYVDGYSYRRVAKAMGVIGDGTTELKKMHKYLRKNFL